MSDDTPSAAQLAEYWDAEIKRLTEIAEPLREDHPTLSGLAAWTAEFDPPVSGYLQLAALTGLAVPDLGARIYFYYGRGGGRSTMVRDTGITVDTILTMIRFGIPAEAILRANSDLEWDDLAACCWEAAHTNYLLYGHKKGG